MNRVDTIGFGKDGKGTIIQQQLTITVGALAGGNAISGTPLTMAEDFRVLKTEVYASMEGITAGEADQLLFGMADGELSDNEIAEALSVAGPLARNDNQGDERSHRPVWIIGAVQVKPAIAVKGQFIGENGGPKMTGNPRWTFSDPSGWAYFVFNYDNSTITTGISVRCHIKSYGVWVT